MRLGDVAWWQRLADLNKSDSWVVHSCEDDLPDPWICPEAREDSFVYDRARDMYVLPSSRGLEFLC